LHPDSSEPAIIIIKMMEILRFIFPEPDKNDRAQHGLRL
jgi:hypothetical protein